MKKFLSMALCLALSMSLLAGCGSSASSSAAASSEAAGSDTLKTVTYANASDIASLDPRRGTSTITASVLADLYSTLVKTDAEGNIVLDAAASYERVDDVTWHFTLRDDVYFTNGDHMTSADVQYTIDSLKNKDAGYALSGDFSFMSVEVLGDYEFNIVTDQPFNSLPLRLNYVKIIPSKYVQEVGDEAFAKNPVGSGPFKFVSWTKDDKVVMEKNPDYYGEVPQIDQLVYKVIPEAADRVAALQAGEVDIICSIPTTQANYLSSTDGVTVVGQPSTRVVWLQFNTINGDSPVNDLKVRQALNYAIDRDSLITGVLDGYAVKVASISTPEYNDYDASVQGYTYDPEKAKSLLAEAGYADGFTVDLSVSGGLLNATDVVQAVASQLAEVGVTVNIQQEDSATQRDKIMSGTVAPIFLHGLGGPYCDIDLIASIGFTKGGRYCTWDSDEFADLASRAAAAVDDTERARLHSEMQQFMVDQAPAVWLYQQDTLYAYNSAKVQNWTARTDEVVLMDGVSVQ